EKTESFLGRDFERRNLQQTQVRAETALRVDHLQGVFLVLAVLEACATLLFAGEVIHYKLTTKPKLYQNTEKTA
ncbi:Ionotropic receptor 119, partial [Hyalella azteca]